MSTTEVCLHVHVRQKSSMVLQIPELCLKDPGGREFGGKLQVTIFTAQAYAYTCNYALCLKKNFGDLKGENS